MSLPRLLIVTGTPPGCKGVGEIFLRDILRLYDPEEVTVAVIAGVPGDRTGAASCVGPVAIETVRVPVSRFFGQHGSVLARTSRLVSQLWLHTAGARDLLRKLVRLGRTCRCDMILGVWGHPLLYGVLGDVAASLEVPLVTMAWDPPELSMLNNGYGRTMGERVLSQAARCLKMSLRAAVISERMGEVYRRLTGVDTVVLRHGFAASQWYPGRRAAASESRASVVYSGSLYALDAWNGLLEAMCDVGWRLGNRDVSVRVLGSGVIETPLSPVRLEILGYHPQQTMLRHIAECDVAYVPLWFSESKKTASQLCFPTKISSYLACGVPVFYHGPRDTAVSTFIERTGVGMCCYVVRGDEVSLLLKEFIEPVRYRAMCEAVTAARVEEFSAEVMRSRFALLLGVDESQLRSVMPSECHCG